jgi:deoxyribonuclease IV
MARMRSDGPRLGAHLALATGMVKAAERAGEIRADALQVFSDNPTAWQRRAEPAPEIEAFRTTLDAHGVAPLAIHASYLINLAGADESLHARSVGLLGSELEAARRFGASLVNVHIGSHRGAGPEAGIEQLASGIRRATDGAPTDGIEPVITLENAAGGGWSLGTGLDDWVAIAIGLERAGIDRDRVAFCLDTAHLWGAGIDVSDPATIDDLLAAFDGEIGLDRLPLLHLNDTKSELGSRMDRHEHVGAGRIGPVGLGHLVRHPRLAHATFMLETPGMEEGYDAINLARARALLCDEPLEPLPPDAFTLRGSRAKAATPPATRSEEATPIAPTPASPRPAVATPAIRRP